MGLSLGCSQGRFLLLQARKNDIAFKQQEEERKQLSQDMELVSSNNKSNETASEEIDMKSEDIPSNILMSNLGITIARMNPIVTQITQIKSDKLDAQGELISIERDITTSEFNLLGKNPTTRSQEDIQKNLDTLTSQIEKATKTRYVQIPATNIFAKTEQLSKGKIKATFKNGKTMTFKNQKEYDNYLKSHGTIQKIQTETPSSIKLRRQKKELEKELDSAKTRDNLADLKQQKEQLENKIAGYDEKLKELEAQKENEKTKENQKDFTDKTSTTENKGQTSSTEETKIGFIKIPESVQKVIDDNIDSNNFKKFDEDFTDKTSSIENKIVENDKNSKKHLSELEQLEHQRDLIRPEIESVQKVIDDNVNKTFKLFA